MRNIEYYMRKIQKSAVVPYSSAKMYHLVNDIESYPEYLPGCSGTTIHLRTEEEVRATIHLSKGGFQQSFSTLNKMKAFDLIEVSLLEGPFRHLSGFWRFNDQQALPLEGFDNSTINKAEACEIQFYLEFSLSNKLLDLAVGAALEKIAHSFLDSFSNRARSIYQKV